MPKKYTRKRRVSRRKSYKKKSFGARAGKSMQDKSLSFVKKKYTVVIPIDVVVNQEVANTTISHMGGRNATNQALTIQLTQCDPDGMLTDQMKLYQFFRITGMAFKLFFPEGTTPESTPVQWSMGYSSNQIIKPTINFTRLQTLQNYQTSSCDSSKPISRFFRTGMAQKRLGIDWVNTEEFVNFGANPPVPLYGGQLPVDAGSSTNIKVYRSAQSVSTSAQIGRLQVTYYITYKGAKGQGSLTV